METKFIKNIHDREVEEIRIKSKKNRIELYFEQVGREKEWLTFHDVFDANLIGIYNQNVLFEISEEPIERFRINNDVEWEIRKKGLFEQFGTLTDYNKNLNENEYKAFGIVASLGLNGWIICKNVVQYKEKN